LGKLAERSQRRSMAGQGGSVQVHAKAKGETQKYGPTKPSGTTSTSVDVRLDTELPVARVEVWR
jgi:hypothetical protein